MPVKAAVLRYLSLLTLQSCHSGLDPLVPRCVRGNPVLFFNVLHSWMPDQVRHDGQKIDSILKYDTASKAGIQESLKIMNRK